MITRALAQLSSLSVLIIVIQGTLKFQNIEQALAFYGVYHRNPINQIIHFVGVPCIIWSLFGFLSFTTVPALWTSRPFSGVSISFLPLLPSHKVNYGTVLFVIYMVFNMKIDPFGGTLYLPCVYAMYATTVSMTLRGKEASESADTTTTAQSKKSDESATNKSKASKTSGTNKILRLYALVHFLGWYVQIHPGHAIYEGAKPAVLDSLGGALTSAPLFAFYEGLWYMGINKELQDQTKVLVEEYTRVICEKDSNAMRACADVVF